MNKQIAIPVILVLSIGALLTGSLLLREHNKLTDAQAVIGVMRESLFSLETVLTEETSMRKLAEAALAEETSKRQLAEAKIITLTQTISGL
ncbi:hypothetical protein LM595_01845, partial [Candidatus Acetothermia bacterium]|nr:hypothetical protein [Candidatus Acetothermia bacterium]